MEPLSRTIVIVASNHITIADLIAIAIPWLVAILADLFALYSRAIGCLFVHLDRILSGSDRL
jgi:hypothetical protein